MSNYPFLKKKEIYILDDFLKCVYFFRQNKLQKCLKKNLPIFRYYEIIGYTHRKRHFSGEQFI